MAGIIGGIDPPARKPLVKAYADRFKYDLAEVMSRVTGTEARARTNEQLTKSIQSVHSAIKHIPAPKAVLRAAAFV